MLRRLLTSLALGLLSALPAYGADLPTTPTAWSAAASRDIEAGYRLFAENHPGMLNKADPGFRARLLAARNRGLAVARQARDGPGFSAALRAFSAVLRDNHAQLVPQLPAEAEGEQWPGFVAAWRGNQLRVFASSLASIPEGAVVTSCDGHDIREVIRSNVFGFEGDPDVPGWWWIAAPDVFVDGGNSMVHRPKRCRFGVAGKAIDAQLAWRPTDSRFRQMAERSVRGEVLEAGLSEPRPKLFWLAMPTFQPGEKAREAYRMAFDALQQRHVEMLAGDGVVIDLRGNGGGSSDWSEQAARAIWGDEAVAAVLAADTSRAWWRASSGNTRYVRDLIGTLRAQDQAAVASTIQPVAEGMEAALARNEPYWIEPVAPVVKPGRPAGGGAFKLPVYVIVPGSCGSACLDALDLFTRMPNTKLIGAPSLADSDYMEVRLQGLPDGLGSAVIPNKMYRGRSREAGQFYRPAIEVDALDWSTAEFRDVIEEDLKR